MKIDRNLYEAVVRTIGEIIIIAILILIMLVIGFVAFTGGGWP